MTITGFEPWQVNILYVIGAVGFVLSILVAWFKNSFQKQTYQKLFFAYIAVIVLFIIVIYPSIKFN